MERREALTRYSTVTYKILAFVLFIHPPSCTTHRKKAIVITIKNACLVSTTEGISVIEFWEIKKSFKIQTCWCQNKVYVNQFTP